jgi:hypothetical protein
VAAYQVLPPFPLAQAGKLVPENGGKQRRVPRFPPVSGPDNRTGPAGLHNTAHRTGIEQGLVAGKKHIIIRRRVGRSGLPRRGGKATADAFPLAPFGVFIADRRNGQIPGQGTDRFLGGDKKDPVKAAQAAYQIQGMPGQGFSPEGGQKFILPPETPGKTAGHENGNNVIVSGQSIPPAGIP